MVGSAGRTIRLDIVHGYGSTGTGGILRGRLRGFLERHPSYLEYKPGEEVDGNKGHTVIVPLRVLPSLGEDMVEDIWAFCENPKAQNKITGKFRRHGEAEVLSAIKLLEKHQRLRLTTRGAVKLYQSQ